MPVAQRGATGRARGAGEAAARLAMAPNLSNAHPAPRYGVKIGEPA